jgi:hypothetical protein
VAPAADACAGPVLAQGVCIITTNLDLSAWHELFDKKRLLDRLTHHCITISHQWPVPVQPGTTDYAISIADAPHHQDQTAAGSP